MAASTPAEDKNRYRKVPRRPDYTIDQDWQSYSAAEHDRWDRLYARALRLLEGRAAPEFLEALGRLELSAGGIPDMERLSDRLEALTGWRVVAVTDLVPDEIFFDHLANRRFPAGAFIRPESELDYLEEPDVFHDVFGHVPMLAVPAYADYMADYGRGGRRAMRLGRLKNLARLYWYTVEFGLVETSAGLRIFGAGILSSAAESRFALEDPSPHKLRFDLGRILRTDYIIDDFQRCYFVIESFDALRRACAVDFGPLYDALAGAEDIPAGELVEGDSILARGSQAYFAAKAASGPG